MLERGYSRSLLKKAYKRALSHDDLLFSEKNKHDSDTDQFITTYNSQQGDFRSILSKYWFLLTSDPIVANFVSKNPSVTYQKSRSFRDCLTSSQFDPLKDSHSNIGTFRCGSWAYCANLDTRRSIVLQFDQPSPWGLQHMRNSVSAELSMSVLHVGSFTDGSMIMSMRRPLATTNRPLANILPWSTTTHLHISPLFL